jgi:hypothetical protein
MRRKSVRIWRVRLVLAVVLACSSGLFAQEFSADFVNLGKGDDQDVTKIYVGKDRMRFEPKKEQMAGAMIMDLSQQKYYILMPERKMYFESAESMDRMHRGMTFFRPTDVNDACPDWQRMAEKNHKIATCHKVGTETVNGRSAVKYEGTSDDGKKGTVWLDSKLRFILKWKGDDGEGGELRNIKEGAQPASLFEVPSDYQKFDMSGMPHRQPKSH